MIFMISLLMCCKTHQSAIEESTTIATDTITINKVSANDSISATAKIDSIIIEEYAVDQGKYAVDQGKYAKTPTRKIKVYGINLSSTWSANKDSLNIQTAHQEKTVSQVKQKTPTKKSAGGKIVFVIIVMTLLLFAGYVVWKNAVQ